MAEKLKLVLKTPKLRLGIKAVIFALSLYLLPLWAALPIALVLYLRPTAFYLNFLGTFASFLFIVFVFSRSLLLNGELVYITALTVFFAALLFYAILGVKNMIFIHRYFVLIATFITLISLTVWGFFSGLIPLIALILITLFVSKDALSSFTPAPPRRATFFAAICALSVATLSWAIFYLNISQWWATIIVLLPFIGVLYLSIKYFQGELFKSDAPFIAVALAIISYALLILVVF